MKCFYIRYFFLGEIYPLQNRSSRAGPKMVILTGRGVSVRRLLYRGEIVLCLKKQHFRTYKIVVELECRPVVRSVSDSDPI
jgi:hypothetical protein